MLTLASLWAQKPVRIGAQVVGGILLLGLVWKAFAPAPVVKTQTERTENRASVKTEKSESELRLEAERSRLQERVRQLEQRDTGTRIIERYQPYPVPVPGKTPAPAPPATQPAPVVVRVADGTPAPIVEGVPPQLVERVIESYDRTRLELERQRDEEAQKRAELERQAAEKAEAERLALIEKTRKEAPAAEPAAKSDEPSGIGSPGVGVLHTGQPFAKVDLARTNVEVGPLKLGKAGLGVFLTRAWREGQVDGGPQVNFRPGKKKSGLFIMGGYQVRERMPVVGVGVEF